jgi:UDP-N-acetylmuramoylalanine-D-glutamate ligase
MQKKSKQKIAILGFGKEGQSVYRFLKKTAEFRGVEIWILDTNENIEIPKGTFSQLGNDYLKDLQRFNIIVRSPGIKYYSPEIQSAIKNGSRVTSLIKLFFESDYILKKNRTYSSQKDADIIYVKYTDEPIERIEKYTLKKVDGAFINYFSLKSSSKKIYVVYFPKR